MTPGQSLSHEINRLKRDKILFSVLQGTVPHSKRVNVNQEDLYMTRTFATFAAAVMLLAAPTTALAAGSDNDKTSSATSVEDTYRMAVKAVDAKDYSKAIELLNDVISEKPRHPNALNYLGYSHRKSGDYARAVSYYKKALSLDPKHRGANEYLGQAFVELGNLKAAVERLDALEKICGVDCEEYKSLKISIDAAMAGKAKQG